MFVEDIKLTVFILLVGLFVIFFLSSIQVVVAQEETPIIFTEIMYDLDGGDDGHEWVEIYNNSDTSYEIGADWRFFDGANHVLNVVQGDTSLESGEVVVIADNAENFLLDYPDYTGTLVDSVVKLNNTGEEIKLSLDNGDTWITQVEYTAIDGAGNGYSLEYLNNIWTFSAELNGTPGYYLVSDETIECPTLEELLSQQSNINEDISEEDENVIEEGIEESVEEDNGETIGGSVEIGRASCRERV